MTTFHILVRGRGRPGRCSAFLFTSPAHPPHPASEAPHSNAHKSFFQKALPLASFARMSILILSFSSDKKKVILSILHILPGLSLYLIQVLKIAHLAIARIRFLMCLLSSDVLRPSMMFGKFTTNPSFT